MKTFTLDWSFIKAEAKEGLRSYFAPVIWLVRLFR